MKVSGMGAGTGGPLTLIPHMLVNLQETISHGQTAVSTQNVTVTLLFFMLTFTSGPVLTARSNVP